MLDLENVKAILQEEVDKREESKVKWKKYRTSDNRSLEEFYERRYNKYSCRISAMCDMLYDLGYLAWTNKNNLVFVERRVTYDDLPF